MRAILLTDIQHPLREIEKALRKEFPRAGIQSVGIGRRRLERSGRALGEETVVKILLRKKLRPLPEGRRRLPRSLALHFHYFGQPVRIRVPVDIEQSRPARLTQYEVGPFPKPKGSLCVACYARWTEDGTDRVGAITAGHGLWPTPESPAPRKTAPVRLPAGCAEPSIVARVRCASHLTEHGLDAALLEFDSQPTPSGLHPCMTRMYKDPVELPNVARLLFELGGADDGNELVSNFRHYLLGPDDFKSIAYFETRPIQVHGWGLVHLKHVVESVGEADTFLGGTSGSGIVTKPPVRLALCIQSMCTDPGEPHQGHNRESLGTALDAARRWINDQLGIDVELFWKPA